MQKKKYLVDKILSKEIKEGIIKYKVKWLGKTEDNISWEPIESISYCKDIIE
jgi:hypothetical protein